MHSMVMARKELTVYDKISMAVVSLLSVLTLQNDIKIISIVAGYLAFGLMWLLSCFTREPLCAAYVKYDYNGEDALNNPIFMKTNYVLAVGWGIRGGPIKPLPAGTYQITKEIEQDIMQERILSPHSSLIGPVVAFRLSQEWVVPAYFTDPVSVDEFIPEAKISGLPEIPRYSALHALNLRAVARKYAESKGKSIDELTAVIAHLGGGFSIAALKKGKLIDSTNPNEEGPFQLERAGSLPVSDFVNHVYENWPDQKSLRRRISGKAG